MQRILVTGALGQIGSELVPALRSRYGSENVVGSDVRMRPAGAIGAGGPFEFVDCTDLKQIQEVVRKHRIDAIFHLAALLSATAEEKPHIAWSVNMGGLYRVLEVARQNRCAVFFPSSIGAFGPSTPKQATPQETTQRPTTMYGVTKVAGELLCDYYHRRFEVDTRGVRFPGLISHVALPGGGTTDYAVEIFYDAIRHRQYTCFLKPETRIDMLYMPDAIQATIDLMEADPSRLTHRNAFNITNMAFTPAILAEEIRRHLPDFRIEYEVDPVRQAIADSWPHSVDDSAARAEWGYAPKFGIEAMTKDMVETLSKKVRSAD